MTISACRASTPAGGSQSERVFHWAGGWDVVLGVRPLRRAAQAEFGWSPSLLGGAVSLSLLVSGLASPIVGRLVDRYQPRRVILIGSLATVVGYVLLSRVQELWQFLALMAFLAFFRAWIFYVPFTTLMTRWFSRRRATAMGIATSGFGLGGLLFLPLMSELLNVVGWRSAFVVGGLLVLLINGLFVASGPKRSAGGLVRARRGWAHARRRTNRGPAPV